MDDATHAWDLNGAKMCGLKTAWVESWEKVWMEGFLEPDVKGGSVDEVVERILGFGV